MENMKRIISVFIALYIAVIPLMNCSSFSYAEDENNTGGGGASWTTITTKEQLVAAFKAYCQTRNYKNVHTPNTLNQIVAWSYNELEDLANACNVNLQELNAYIWWKYTGDGYNYVKFLFDDYSTVKFSLMYATLLERANMQANQQKEIYNGKWFEDNDGNGCFIYVIQNGKQNQGLVESDFNQYVQKGSIYITSGKVQFNNMVDGEVLTKQLKSHNNTYTYYLRCTKDYNANRDICNGVGIFLNSNTNHITGIYNTVYFTDDYYETQKSHFAIINLKNTNSYYFGAYQYYKEPKTNTYRHVLYNPLSISIEYTPHSVNAQQGDMTDPPTGKNLQVDTKETSVNNYITNNNSNVTYNYTTNNPANPDPLPTTPDYPTGGNIDPDGNIHWTMPDLNIDWHLDLDVNNLPFPFSIPFDLIHFMDLMDSEPVAPHFEATIDLGIINYDLDIDLSEFDDVAAYIRTFVLLTYCFGLAIATRALFHIY